tara:strand:+ start:1902 stop:2444 length:543 start_codon:yes stop_codon:yes gene_type:complete
MASKMFLVTGGAGFIGSAVIRELILNTDYRVVNVDKLTYAGNLESLAPVESNERCYFEQVDICDAGEIKRVLNKYQPDYVMHLAAESHVDRSIDGPAEFINTNIMGTYTLLEFCRACWSGLKSVAPETPKGVDQYRDLIMFVADHSGHDQRYVISAAKIERELGWCPQESFDSGIRKTIH